MAEFVYLKLILHNRSHAIGQQANIIVDFCKQPLKPVIVVALLLCKSLWAVNYVISNTIGQPLISIAAAYTLDVASIV